MEHAQHALHTANARDHIVQCTVAANNVLHMEVVQFVQDIHNSHAVHLTQAVQFVLQIIHVNIVQDILHAQFVEHIISANTATDIPMDQMHLVDVLHRIHIIAIVQTIIK
jgi:hypothetical protein